MGPELDLLCHIEESGYRLPDGVSGDAVARAAAAVRTGPRPVGADRPATTYYDSPAGGDLHRTTTGHPTELALARVLAADRRWLVSDTLWRQHFRGAYDDEKLVEYFRRRCRPAGRRTMGARRGCAAWI